jgi:ketosteroid isomerase-like protein
MTVALDVCRRYVDAIADGTSNTDTLIDQLYDEDVDIEFPFARTAESRRVAGREAFRAVAAIGRAMPLRIDGVDEVRIHQTADPEVVVAEYAVRATLETNERTGTAGFVVVLRVRGGRIVELREYQDTAAMLAAFAG